MPGPSQFALQGTVIGTGSLIAPGGQAGLQGNTGAMGDGLPVGTVYAYTSTTAPAGSMLCDGSQISRTLYPAAFAVIGTQFGSGDGSTTFNLPDLRSRFVLGSGQGSGLTSRIIASTGGEENHVLVVAELASHTHGGVDHLHDLQNHYHYCSGVDHLHGLGGHSHSCGQPASINYGTTSPGYAFYQCTGGNTGGPNAGSNASDRSLAFNSNGPSPNNTGAADRSLITSATGSGTGHNTIPPYVVLAYMIKVAAGSGPSNTAPLADTTQSGLLRQVSGAVTDYVGGDNTCHALPQPGASAGFISKSAAYTLLSGDSGKYILCTGDAWTLTLPIAATNLMFRVRNDQGLVQSGTITIQPQSGSLIDGVASITILPGQQCEILSDGTNWRTFGIQRRIVLGILNPSNVASQIVPLTAGYAWFDLQINRLSCNTGTPNLQVQCSLDGSTFITSGYYGMYWYNSAAAAVSVGTYNNSANAYLTHWLEAAARHLVKHEIYPGDASSYFSWSGQSGGMYSTNAWVGAFTLAGFSTTAGRMKAMNLVISAGTYSGQITLTGIV